jgi:hypothetical protein
MRGNLNHGRGSRKSKPGIRGEAPCYSGPPLKRALPIGVLLFSGLAAAHPLDVGALDVRVEAAHLEIALDVSEIFWRKLAGVGESAPLPTAQTLLSATLASGPLTVSGEPCRLVARQLLPDGERLILHAEAACTRAADGSEGELAWKLAFVSRGTLTFQLLVHVDRSGVIRELVLEPGSEEIRIAGESSSGFGDFILMGMRHIGATPSEWWEPTHRLHLPEGIDHILFLLALLLIDVQFVPVLKTVTGFTIGHSITLSLAALGLVRLPARLIESAIALTIAFVAAEDLGKELTHRKARPRWQIAMAFGLIHGFGFARALSDLHLTRARLLPALIGFNLGVEIGQEIVVLIVAPLLWLLYRIPRARRIAAPVFAAAILVAALVWFVQRAFG